MIYLGQNAFWVNLFKNLLDLYSGFSFLKSLYGQNSTIYQWVLGLRPSLKDQAKTPELKLSRKNCFSSIVLSMITTIFLFLPNWFPRHNLLKLAPAHYAKQRHVLANTKMYLQRFFSILWDKKFSAESLDAPLPPAMHKVFRYEKLSVTPKEPSHKIFLGGKKFSTT